MFISKIIGAVSSKINPIGDLYRESNNGIKVYRHVAKNGKVKLSSFMPDGKPFKTVVRENINETTFSPDCVIVKTHGHNTEVKNHHSGVTTQIKDLTVQYDYSAMIISKAKRKLNKPQNAVAKEFYINSQKDGNFIGKFVFREDLPNKGTEIVAEYDKFGNEIFSETKQFKILG